MNEIIFPEVNSLTCLRKIPSSGTSAAHCEVKKRKVYSVNQREWRRTDRLRMDVGIPTLPLTDLETQLSTREVLSGSPGSPGSPVLIQEEADPWFLVLQSFTYLKRGCRPHVRRAKHSLICWEASKEELHPQARRRAVRAAKASVPSKTLDAFSCVQRELE